MQVYVYIYVCVYICMHVKSDPWNYWISTVKDNNLCELLALTAVKIRSLIIKAAALLWFYDLTLLCTCITSPWAFNPFYSLQLKASIRSPMTSICKGSPKDIKQPDLPSCFYHISLPDSLPFHCLDSFSWHNLQYMIQLSRVEKQSSRD